MQPQMIKGRGALTNPHNRYERLIQVKEEESECFDQEDDTGHQSKPVTEVLEQQAKSILSKNQSPDVPHEQSVNPYAGCEHGCVYCYARPTHAYHDFSPGLDFETKIIAKTNAHLALEDAFNQKRYHPKPILIGANTDAYQPIEAHQKITRKLLETCLEYCHPVSIITKSTLIERDLDLLAALAEKGLCSVRLSVTTLDHGLKRKLEPRTASGAARLKTIERLVQAGVPTGVIVAPIIPSINDSELETILSEAKKVGANSANYILLRLPLEVKELFSEWLATHFPQRAKHVLSLIEQSRGGKLYDSNFKTRMTGEGVFAEMIAQRFSVTCQKLGLAMTMKDKLNNQLFQPSSLHSQMSLF